MKLINLLKTEAVKRKLLDPSIEIDPAVAFALVRDMPYRRASDRHPETIITEWQGTCSGKHYLLKELFAELGLHSHVIACTTVTPVDESKVAVDQRPLYETANRRFVDVHNYLVVDLPQGGQMLVDATWPLSARAAGMVVNETFILGEDQQPAAKPLQTWVIPDDRDPQEFKAELLRRFFTPAELQFREKVIEYLGAEVDG